MFVSWLLSFAWLNSWSWPAVFINWVLGVYKTDGCTAAALVWRLHHVKTEECRDQRLYLCDSTEQGHRQGTGVLNYSCLLLFHFSSMTFHLIFLFVSSFTLCVFKSLLLLTLANQMPHIGGGTILTISVYHSHVFYYFILFSSPSLELPVRCKQNWFHDIYF